MKKIRRWSDNEADLCNRFYTKILPLFDNLTRHEATEQNSFLPFIQPCLSLASCTNNEYEKIARDFSSLNFGMFLPRIELYFVETFWHLMQIAKSFVLSNTQLDTQAKNISNQVKHYDTDHNPFATASLVMSILDIDALSTNHYRRIRQMYDQS